MAADTFAFYLATRFMPLADVMTFYMAAPLIVVALSAPLLGERVERFRWIAVARRLRRRAGGAAAVAVDVLLGVAAGAVRRHDVRARSGGDPQAQAHPLAAADCLAVRRRRLIGAATTPFAWTTPGGFDLGLMFLLGVVSMICFIFITRALSMARAAVLAPLQYTSIVWATIIGWLVWRDAPTWPIVLGNAIIIGSGLYLATRDVQWRAAAAAEPVALTPRE